MERSWCRGSNHPKAALHSPVLVLLHPWCTCQGLDPVWALYSVSLLLKGRQERTSMDVLERERERRAGAEGHD